MNAPLTPVHVALFDAVAGALRESGASQAEATDALVDVACWLAGVTTAGTPEGRHGLAHTIAIRAFNAAQRPAFREV